MVSYFGFGKRFPMVWGLLQIGLLQVFPSRIYKDGIPGILSAMFTASWEIVLFFDRNSPDSFGKFAQIFFRLIDPLNIDDWKSTETFWQSLLRGANC